ncbi:MAG TPA: alcohol dehydrogenase catalytic domain-containing protein [Pseudonocardiaceae bacterium]|jgi:L-iditol 2-dehydrogenase/L-idonate 5-dehydrogenase|nr:alcohol dehydrogenase catalytic domain-containing protein [Pseudonocardiaceae bacterium]
MDTQSIEALRVHGADDLRVDAEPAPARGPGDAVIGVEYGGICGSDLHYWRDGAVGASVLRAPMILGHEVVGTVLSTPDDAAVGTRVVPHPATTCGRCEWCQAGQRNLCADLRYLGSAARFPHTDGGFATRIVVPADRLIPVPAGVAARRAVLAEPAGVAWHAVNRASAVGARLAGARVLVVGAGPIGLLVTAVLRHRGAREITVLDTRARPLRVAGQVGADRGLPAAEASGLGAFADIAFESSGTPAGLATALHGVRPGGTVVAVGQQPGGDLALPAWLFVTHELTVTGSLRLDAEIPAALDFLADPGVDVDAIVSHVYPLRAAPAAFTVAADADTSSKVLLEF